MSYEPGRYLLRNDAKEAPPGQRLSADAPMIVRVVSCHSKLGTAVIDVILDAGGYAVRDSKHADLAMLKAFYKLIAKTHEAKVIEKQTRGKARVRIPPRSKAKPRQVGIEGLCDEN